MAKTFLPPGFRFHPTDVELVKYYLKRKVMGKKFQFEAIAEVDIYKYAPWHLPEKSCLRNGDLKWYFFCPREKKYANGARTNRATEFGFWKTTGKDRHVKYDNEVVGMIKTLVFHRGKAPRGDRTDWVMHEYRIQENDLSKKGIVQDAYVLCSVFQKEGPGPRNGAQYGAPFREEDWDDDDEDTDCMEVLSSALLPPVASNHINTVVAGSHVPESQCIGTSESCLSDTAPSTYKLPSLAPTNDNVPKEFVGTSVGDDIERMLAQFTEDSMLISNENDQNKEPDVDAGNIEAPPCSDGNDIYKDLRDLGNLAELSGDGYDLFADDNADYNMNGGSLGDNMTFIELCDLDAPLTCPTESNESEISTNEMYTGQNCYMSELFTCQLNPCSSHSHPVLPAVPTRFEDQMGTSLKNNNGWGNAKQTALDHGATSLFKQLSEGSSNASENLNSSGSNYPW